jgi:hypothetical protein
MEEKKMEKSWSILGMSAVLAATVHAGPVKQIELADSDVATIHTAVGFSTLIEFPAKPNNVVLGDQDSFKVEYIGNSITVKPLNPRGKSNLFVFTEFGRFNLVLVSGANGDADYLVKVRPAGEPKETLPPKPLLLNRSASFQGFCLKVLSWTPLAKKSANDALMTIEFEISSKKSAYTFDPRALGIVQNRQFMSIESLLVDSTQILPGQLPVRGRMTLKRADLLSDFPLKLVFAVPTKKSTVFRITVLVGQPLISERRDTPFVVPKDKRKNP